MAALFLSNAPTEVEALSGQTITKIDQSVSLSPRRPLIAHVRFCIVYEDQCVIRHDRRVPGRSARDRLNEIADVNWSVNQAIIPQADTGFDTWDIDVSRGDCEDYALQKRKELIDRGWPTNLLRIAIARTQKGIHHAVLLVRIDGVDYALDNLTSRVVPWNETPYSYVMLQDLNDPKSWHDIQEDHSSHPRIPLS